MMAGYPDEAARMRRSLDDRIRDHADTTGMPHDRIRKLILFQRLAARFEAIDDDRLRLKGGVTLLWRVGERARATKDVDANWAGSNRELDAFLDAITLSEVGDLFTFEIGPPVRLEGETLGALRHSVTAFLDGREFGRFRLDVNLVNKVGAGERLDVDTPILEPFGLARVSVIAISIEQQLAEKLHATVRAYGDSNSSRIKDAYDTVVLVQSVAVPSSSAIRAALGRTFATRETAVPAEPPRIPADWYLELNGLLAGFSVPGVSDVDVLVSTWEAFWRSILDVGEGTTRWDPDSRRWR